MASYSELSAAKTCARKWDYQYRHRIRTKEQSPTLERGSALHEGIKEWWLTKDLDGSIMAAENYLSVIDDDKLRRELQEEVAELLEYHLPVLDCNGRYVVADSGELLGSDNPVPMLEYKFNYMGFMGYIDAVLFDTHTMEYVLVDWKLRRTPYSVEDIMIDGQLPFYATVLNQMGANISRAIMWQFKLKPPQPAQKTPGGKLKKAYQLTTWEKWEETVTEELLDGKSIGYWEGIMRPKLKEHGDFVVMADVPLTEHWLDKAWQDALASIGMIDEYIEMLHERNTLPGTLNVYACKFCDFKRICVADQSGIERVEDVMREDFVDRVGRTVA